MTIHISRPRDRKTWTPPRGLGAKGAGSGRGREALALSCTLLLVLLGAWLVARATLAPMATLSAEMTAGRILNLNTLSGADKLTPLLTTAFTDPGERSYVATRIWQRITEPGAGPLPNVGELGRLRVRAEDLKGKTLPTFAARLAELKAKNPAAENPSVRLLTSDLLSELKPQLIVRLPETFRAQFWRWMWIFAGCFAAVHLVWRWRRFAGDQIVLPVLALLTGLGCLVMVSVRDPLRDLLLFGPYVQGVAAGCLLLLVGSSIDLERFRLERWSFAALGGALALGAALIVFGSGPGGSDAKVNLLGVQPVEIIKVLIVFFLAGYFAERWEFLRELKERRLKGILAVLRLPKLEYLLTPIAAMALVLVFFFLQKDLGPALVLSFLFFGLYAVARGKPTMAILGTLGVIAGFYVGYTLGIPRTVSGRIGMWLSPWDNLSSGGDHLAHSLWALSSGGLLGTGLGLGRPSFVPAVHTDMILAALGEELGFVGLCSVFLIYGLLLWRFLRAAARAKGAYTFFLALGLTFLVALQVVLMSGGVLGLLPLSGVVTPFLSFGRTAMLANFLLVGMILGISSHPASGKAVERFAPAVKWCVILVAAVVAAVLARAGYIQLLRADEILVAETLTVEADGGRRFRYNPRLLEIAQRIPRGSIVDRNGVVLATSELKELAAQKETLAELRAIFDPIAGGEGRRYYPFGGLTFHLLGDINAETNFGATNASYIERDAKKRLQGYDDYAQAVQVEQPGSTEKQTVIRRDLRELVPLWRYRHRPNHPAVRRILDGDCTVKMALDIRLEQQVAKILAQTAREVNQTKGAAVVLDATDGDLLASVGLPWPERLPVEKGERSKEILLDRARYGVYPPGSTFKIVTAMAALRFDPTIGGRTFQCVHLTGGRVGNKVRGLIVRDDQTVSSPHGAVNLERGITYSCNAYFSQLGALAVGPASILETANQLGIEVARPNTPEELRKLLPQASYGQGEVTATPFEMARVAATIANGGQMSPGRWVINIADDSRAKMAPVAVVSPTQADTIARSMRQVVEVGSASAILREVSPPIAGKTGTAEVTGKPSHSWFIGYAPYGGGGRKIAFAVLVENGGYGGRVAAKAAGRIVETLAELGYFKAPETPP